MLHRWKILALALLLATPGIASAQDPEDPENYTWTEEGVLARGGGGLDRGDVDFLHGEGFRAIVDLRYEHDDPEAYIEEKGMAYLDLPIEHTVDINVTHLETFMAWAKDRQADGQPVYVHCRSGWHRAAAFAAAWVMEREGLSFDETAERMEERRPGTVMRTPGPLLQYEARITGEPGLTTLLHASRTHPPEGGTMPAAVEVLLPDGRPAAGAEVHVWSEEGDMDLRGETNAEGRFEFTYRAPTGHVMDHLNARASLPGHVDGADNVEMFFFDDGEVRGATQVNATLTDAGLHVRVPSDDDRTPTRFIATTDSGWFAFAASIRAEATLPTPPAGETVRVRAEVWGGETGRTTLEVPGTSQESVAYAGDTEQPPGTDPAAGEAPQGTQEPDAGDAPDEQSSEAAPERRVVTPVAAGLVAILLAALRPTRPR